jgi:hypothetical protein
MTVIFKWIYNIFRWDITNPSEFLYTLNDKQKAIIAKQCPDFKSVKYMTKVDVPFTLMINNELQQICVQCGFLTDGVSSGFSISNNIDVNTAICHDFLYATHPCDKSICDNILLPYYRRIIVKLFGKSAWQSSGTRGALFVCIINNITYFRIYSDFKCTELKMDICLGETFIDQNDEIFSTLLKTL